MPQRPLPLVAATPAISRRGARWARRAISASNVVIRVPVHIRCHVKLAGKQHIHKRVDVQAVHDLVHVHVRFDLVRTVKEDIDERVDIQTIYLPVKVHVT